MTDTASSLSLADEIDARQEAVLAQLEQLNDRVELFLLEVLRERKEQETPPILGVIASEAVEQEVIEESAPSDQHARAA